MTPEEILSDPTEVLTQDRHKSYFIKGVVPAPELFPDDILKGL